MDMEKASLIVEKNKKNKIIVKLKMIESGKVVPVQKFHPENVEMNGVEVDVLRENGQPVLIRDGDKILFDAGAKAANNQKPIYDDQKRLPDSSFSIDNEKLETEHVEYVQHPAYAPYNFVPLNSKVVTIKTDTDDKDNKKRPNGLKFDAYHDGYHTGWIDIQIEAMTPMFIRGKSAAPDFYALSGKPSIPGSSLRGMIRQMVEVVGFGKIGFFNDKKTLYYRGLADRSNLRNEYQSRMSSYDRNRKVATYNVSAGIIRKKGLSYFLTSTSFDRIPKGEARKLIANLEKRYTEFEFYDLNNSEKYEDHYLVVSGNMNNKKHDWRIKKVDPDKNSPKKIYEIPEEDIHNYKNDKTRKELKDENDEHIPSILNLIDLLDRGIEQEVPCFYVMWKDAEGKNRFSFGHTAMFRLAYEKTIGDHVPEELTNKDACDIAGAIFGNEDHFSSRVFFEDALIEDGQKDIFLGEKHLKILSGPKPTTFQHYLVQVEEHIKNRKHYNSNSSIRGTKMYWHKTGDDWSETDTENINKHPKQYSEINPVRKGGRFLGRIRFENLSDIELGALLFNLELPEGCYHKIGMGKPVGLGSIKISPKLYLSDRKKRYKHMFAEWNNEVSEYEDRHYFVNIFEKHVLQDIGEDQVKSLWCTNRLKELLSMLHYETGIQLDGENKTDYMELQHFKNRSILPKPSQLVGSKTIETLMEKIKKSGHKKASDEKKGDDADFDVTEPDLSPGYIRKIEIDSLWDKYHIEWELNRDVNVLIGLNGSGKSTVLRLIKHVLLNEAFVQEKYSSLPNIIKIIYDKGKPSIYRSSYKISEFKLEKLDGAISSKRIDEESKKRGGSVKDGEKIIITNSILKEVTEKLNLLQDWAKKEKTFESKIEFLSEVSKKCGKEWVKQNKDELLTEFYVAGKDLNVVDVDEYIYVVLIVTFDRYLTQAELDKVQGNQSVLSHDVEGTYNHFKTEIDTLSLDENSDKIKILVEIINMLFEDTGKKVSFGKDEGLYFSKGDEPIDMAYLSSGEKQLLYILLHVFLGSIQKKPVILLMDEPETSLHVGWQIAFINHIRELNKNMQIIIASHSPAMTMEGWKGIETHMHKIMRKSG